MDSHAAVEGREYSWLSPNPVHHQHKHTKRQAHSLLKRCFSFDETIVRLSSGSFIKDVVVVDLLCENARLFPQEKQQQLFKCLKLHIFSWQITCSGCASSKDRSFLLLYCYKLCRRTLSFCTPTKHVIQHRRQRFMFHLLPTLTVFSLF